MQRRGRTGLGRITGVGGVEVGLGRTECRAEVLQGGYW